MKALCPDCYIEDHAGHEKRKLKTVYEESKSEVGGAMDILEGRIGEFRAKEQAMEEEVKKVKREEPGKKEEIEEFA